MTMRKSFKIAWVFALVASLALIVVSARLEQLDRETARVAGLAAAHGQVAFDKVSEWGEGSVSRIVSGIVSSYGGYAGSTVSPKAVPARLGSHAVMPGDKRRLDTEAYDPISDNPFIAVAVDPRSTFSVDVDTASYSNMRRFITQGRQPPKDSLRIEEMINYFTYEYSPPAGGLPISVSTEVADAPWQPDHRLVRIGLRTKEIDMSSRPPANLVFLIDVSGSMDEPAKLPLLKNSMKLLVDNLNATDRVAIVVYAGEEGLALPSTTGNRKSDVLGAIENLSPGGSTNGAAGIQLAYSIATSNFIKGGINRVILATDGDFNVGVTNEGDLVRLIREKARTGVFLSVLGFGEGDLKDSALEKLADEGNGHYAYIDTLSEARKSLVQEMGSTLVTVAKDVKIQVEFNPAEVRAYRLIGYENRLLRNEDFNNDAKDAGDIGAGHCVTALFEVVPSSVEFALPSVDPLKYQQTSDPARTAAPGELLNLKIRYKEPSSDVSSVIEVPVVQENKAFDDASEDFRFAAAVAAFGMILRESPHQGQATLASVAEIAQKSRGLDRNGYRSEFIQLVRKTQELGK